MNTRKILIEAARLVAEGEEEEDLFDILDEVHKKLGELVGENAALKVELSARVKP